MAKLTPTEWRTLYERRIKSAQWKNMRRDIARMRGDKCERCEATLDLALHHKTYERLGQERLSDLELLCQPCHDTADVERAERGRARSQKALLNAALDTYATKKYGEDWQDRFDEDAIAEEFDDWLDSRPE